MALGSNELYSSNSQSAYPRIQPDQGPGAVVVKTYDHNSADVALELPVGTPLARSNSTGFWIPWTDGAPPGAAGVSTIAGFVYPEPVTIPASSDAVEILGQVMVKGTVHYDDCVAALTTLGYTTFEPELKQAMRYVDPTTFLPQLKSQGLHIDGLDSVP